MNYMHSQSLNGDVELKSDIIISRTCGDRNGMYVTIIDKEFFFCFDLCNC